MSTSHNHLTAGQLFKLALWLRDQDRSRSLQQVSIAEACERAAAALGFRVTRANMLSAQETAGVYFGRRVDRLPPEQQIRDLAREVIALRERLGEPVTAELRRQAGTLL